MEIWELVRFSVFSNPKSQFQFSVYKKMKQKPIFSKPDYQTKYNTKNKK